MRSRHAIRILLAIGVAALLAVLAGTLAERSTAAPSAHQGLSGVKFKVRYEGTFDATWHDSSPVQLPDPQHTFRCSGGDSSGTLTSSVHSNSKAFIFTLGYEPGGSWLSPGFRPANGSELATVTSNRTAQGWFMRYSGHECVRYDIPQPGCAEHTFQGVVAPINSSSGRLGSGPKPVYHVYLDWQLEPELAIGCSDDIVYPGDFGYGWQDAVLRAKPLYRCGLQKPRRCKLTIGRERTYVHNVTDGDTTYSSTVHVKWTVTFTPARRSG
jgi:hypothetical protein